MAYTTALRDHVWAITSDGTGGGFTQGNLTAAQERFQAIRWLPAAGADTITLEVFKEDGTSLGIVWESVGGGSTIPQESYLQLRCVRGFKLVMSTGGKCYLYQVLDSPAGW